MSKLMRGVRWVQSGQGEARVEDLSFFLKKKPPLNVNLEAEYTLCCCVRKLTPKTTIAYSGQLGSRTPTLNVFISIKAVWLHTTFQLASGVGVYH